MTPKSFKINFKSPSLTDGDFGFEGLPPPYKMQENLFRNKKMAEKSRFVETFEKLAEQKMVLI